MKTKGKDAIGAKASTVETMVGRLLTTQQELRLKIAELERAEAEVRKHRDHLEEMVEERTRELRDAQERLVGREKLAVLGQMAGGIGHELRNPLSVINSAIYLLKTSLSDGDETSAEYLDMISAQVRASEQIISSLLNFARSRPPDRRETPVPALVSVVLERHPASWTVRVAVEIAADVPAVVADPQQVALALGNLISNAYQAMPEGGKLTIAGRVQDGRVALTVSDTGGGIAPENMEKIFEPLFTTKRRGIGLGLAICRSLVLANGGTLEVESTKGEGSAFTITLPSEFEPEA